MLSGCYLGHKHRYDDVTIPLAFSGRGKVAVAVSDRRPYVLARRKRQDFVGLSRTTFGEGIDVTTESGEPLASDMTTALVRSLRAAGYEGVAVAVGVGEPSATTLAKLQATGAQRALLVVLFEWKSDTWRGTNLFYDATLRVLDGAGQVMARSAIAGTDNLGGSTEFNPGGYAEKKVPPAFRREARLLLSDPQVIAALR
jgi:hypothetical protein